MLNTFLNQFSAFRLQWLMLLFLGIIIGNAVLKWMIYKIAAQKKSMKKGILTSVPSLLNWITFYLVILLFLIYFSKSEWLFYPLYSQRGVDVSLFLIIVAIMIVSLAHRLVKLITRYALTPVYDYYDLDSGLGYTLNKVIYYTVMILALAVSFTSVGINLTALGAVFGALGIGIGFGMRNIAGNFVSGIIVLFERPIEVGEIVQIDQRIGRVERIRLRSTIVRTATEGVLIVPNQYFIEQIIKNRTGVTMMAQVTISVRYGEDTLRVEQLLYKAAEQIREDTEGILPSPDSAVRFVNIRNQSMDFLVELPVTSFQIKEQVESDLRHAVIQLFREMGVSLASFAETKSGN